MAPHVCQKRKLQEQLEDILQKTLGEIDTKGVFAQFEKATRQKGIVGTLIERCVLGYEFNTAQEPDLVVVDGEKKTRVELKTTGIVLKDGKPPFVAKEPMSITAVGVPHLGEQEFETSHFWEKLAHLLIIYYHYLYSHPVPVSEYKKFLVKGYEFHEFSADDKQGLKRDWECVWRLAKAVVKAVSLEKGTKEWEKAVRDEYIRRHGYLRRVLTYIDLAPKYPPRFRLKQPVVSQMVFNHFGNRLEQLPAKYISLDDVDRKCDELTQKYKGKKISELAKELKFTIPRGEAKSITETVITAMFGGKSRKMGDIELFTKFGIIGKSIVMTAEGGRTEDMKLFRLDFDSLTQRTVIDEESGSKRNFVFEDSPLYSYFADHTFLCIIFQEPPIEYVTDEAGRRIAKRHPLSENTFVGFRRLFFDDVFINGPVKSLYKDTREKILKKTLVDVIATGKDGKPRRNKSGSVQSAPNFMKSKENEVFIRGGATDSSDRYKTECVNGIKMIPQFVWIRGRTIVDELKALSGTFAKRVRSVVA